MRETEYAIVDIETTGGNASGSCITEIAIIIHNGKEIIDRFETLVNPQKDIPLPIFALTGINNEMVRDAPIFDAISEKVFEMLNGRIFVAHNVNFDYSFVRHQLQESGFKWTARKLCTVRAARKIKPGLSSYSLGNLCRCLEIPVENRHRAGGDADATAILFTRLLDWDQEGHLSKMLKATSQDQRLPPNLPPSDFEQLPEKPGIYYFYDQNKKVIYVGKAVNIKKRVASHFTGNNVKPQRQNFLRDIYNISFEVCATELMALLLEYSEIKKLWPAYNRALKRFEPKFGLHEYEARSGHKHLAIGRLNKFQTCVEVFNSEYEGVNLLLSLSQKFEIDQRFCSYSKLSPGDFLMPQHHSDYPETNLHNAKVEDALEYLIKSRPSFAIIDKGRSADERSCVWIENGHFYGMGYFPTETAITEALEIKEYLTPYQSSQYIMQLVSSFAEKNPRKVYFSKNLQQKETERDFAF